jgi:hypothetical protein
MERHSEGNSSAQRLKSTNINLIKKVKVKFFLYHAMKAYRVESDQTSIQFIHLLSMDNFQASFEFFKFT